MSISTIDTFYNLAIIIAKLLHSGEAVLPSRKLAVDSTLLTKDQGDD
jgi:hypothetical protein